MEKQPVKRRVICTATTRTGQPCRAWAVPGTDPPRCAPHGGAGAKPGAPVGNQNALTHGYYARNWGEGLTNEGLYAESHPDVNCGSHAESPVQDVEQDAAGTQEDVIVANSLTDVITYITEDLVNKYITLSRYIDRNFVNLSPPAMSHLFALHAQIASRIGRLLRDHKAVESDVSTEMQKAIDIALDELSEKFGTPL
ncbi:MAG: hypothetical protein P1S60_18415 [Anaerolineae bacterium]|nr:hypothetical protein [Anaerolineae bacterium]